MRVEGILVEVQVRVRMSFTLIFLLNFGSAQVLVSQECRMQANVTDRLLDEW